jgi:hypothetical protein
MNEFLLKEFLEEEVKSALDSIGDFKAPGPDGMPSIFYKNLWDIVGRKLTTDVLLCCMRTSYLKLKVGMTQ